MNKRFSFWEVMISSAIVLVLAFVLIGSVVIMFRANSRLTAAKTQTKCLSDLQRIIEHEFQLADSVYSIDDPSGEIRLKKVGDAGTSSDAVAFLSGQDLKVFIKKSSGNNFSYFYENYELMGDKIEENKPIKDWAKPQYNQNLFSKGCFAKKGDPTFSLKTIDQYKSKKTAILFELRDSVFSSDGVGKELSTRWVNEFR